MELKLRTDFTKRSRYICLAILTLLLSLLFFYQVTTSFRMSITEYNYDGDFGRDLLRMTEIMHGKFTLIGPQLSFSGIHTAPYVFYLFVPILWASGYQYQAVVYANALLFLIGCIGLYIYLTRQGSSRFWFLGLLWLASSPSLLLAARSPGNAFTYLIFMICLFAFLWTSPKLSKLSSLLCGVVSGIILNFHPVTILIVPTTTFIQFFKQNLKQKGKDQKKTILLLGFFVLGCMMTFTPVLLFDMRHGFLITKKLMQTSSYQDFFSGSGTHIAASGNSIMTMNSRFKSTIIFTPLGLSILLAFIIFSHREKKRWVPLYMVAILSLLALSFSGKGAVHYFVPIFIYIELLTIFALQSSRFRMPIIVGLLVIQTVFFFPKQLYTPARNVAGLEQNFSQLLGSQMLPNAPINVVLFNDQPLSKVGYEYRFLLEKNNYIVPDEFSYASSPYLLMISEHGQLDWQHEQSWELSQFGNKQLIRTQEIGNFSYYLFSKQN